MPDHEEKMPLVSPPFGHLRFLFLQGHRWTAIDGLKTIKIVGENARRLTIRQLGPGELFRHARV